MDGTLKSRVKEVNFKKKLIESVKFLEYFIIFLGTKGAIVWFWLSHLSLIQSWSISANAKEVMGVRPLNCQPRIWSMIICTLAKSQNLNWFCRWIARIRMGFCWKWYRCWLISTLLSPNLTFPRTVDGSWTVSLRSSLSIASSWAISHPCFHRVEKSQEISWPAVSLYFLNVSFYIDHIKHIHIHIHRQRHLY